MSAGLSIAEPATRASGVPDSLPRALDPAAAIAFCAAFSLVLFLPPVLNDGDTFWQIRTGEWILDHRAILHTDPFSFTAAGQTWFPHEWLAETLMAIAWRAGGMAGVMALTALAVGLTAAILIRHARRFLPGPYALLAVVLALANAAPSLLARPHVLTWPCLALWCACLAGARARRAAPPLWLALVMLLWVNMHGSFVIGLLVAGAFAVEALFDPGADRRRTVMTWGGFILVSFAAALLNPEFLQGVLFPFRMTQSHALAWIGEWQPVDFSRLQLLEVMILAGLALGFTGKVRLPPIRLLMLLGLVHGALAHARNEQLLGLTGLMVLAEPLGAALGRGHAPALGGAWRGLSGLGLAAAAAALIVRVHAPLPPGRTGEAFAAVLDKVPAEVRATPVLNEYGLGGQLIFQGVRPFVDSRADLYGDAFLADYRAIVTTDRAALERAVARYRIGWTMFPSGEPIVGLLDRDPAWRRLFETDGLIVHARVAAPGERPAKEVTESH